MTQPYNTEVPGLSDQPNQTNENITEYDWNSASEIMKAVTKFEQPLGFIVPTPGKGNCFFEAVVQVVSTSKYQSQLTDAMKVACSDHLSLRKAVVDYIDGIYNKGCPRNGNEEWFGFLPNTSTGKKRRMKI